MNRLQTGGGGGAGVDRERGAGVAAASGQLSEEWEGPPAVGTPPRCARARHPPAAAASGIHAGRFCLGRRPPRDWMAAPVEIWHVGVFPGSAGGGSPASQWKGVDRAYGVLRSTAAPLPPSGLDRGVARTCLVGGSPHVGLPFAPLWAGPAAERSLPRFHSSAPARSEPPGGGPPLPSPRGRRWMPHAATAARGVLAATDGHATLYVAVARWLSGQARRARPQTRGCGVYVDRLRRGRRALVVVAMAARASGHGGIFFFMS